MVEDNKGQQIMTQIMAKPRYTHLFTCCLLRLLSMQLEVAMKPYAVKPKILTIWSFPENACQPQSRRE